MECGPACLKIIAMHYNIEISIKKINDLTETSRLGTNFLSLANTAKKIGFETMPVKISLNQLINFSPFPCIVYWEQNHFVVVYKITHKHIYVSDPGFGLIKYPKSVFLKKWINGSASVEEEGGVALLLKYIGTVSIPLTNQYKSKFEIISTFRRFARPYYKNFTLIIIILLVLLGIQFMIPMITKRIVDFGIQEKNLSFIKLMLIYQVMLFTSQMFFEFIRNKQIHLISNKLNVTLISTFIEKLFKLPIKYFESRLTGDLIQRIRDYDRVQNFLTNSSLSSIFSLLTLTVYSILLLKYSVTLFIIFLAMTSGYFLWYLYFFRKLKSLNYERFRLMSNNSSSIIEIISGMTEIKINNSQKLKKFQWDKIQMNILENLKSTFNVEQKQQNGSRFINEIKNILLMYFATKLVVEDQITLGTMFAISFIIGQLNMPVNNFLGLMSSWHETKLSMNRIKEIQDLDDEKSGTEIISNFKVIVVKNITFKYNNSLENVIDNISFTLKKDEVTAIVGESGSGKSTLLKILLGYYTPNSGSIEVNDINLKQININEYRRSVGVVMQEGYIFNDTIENNISPSSELINTQHLDEVSKATNIFSFIEKLPLGYKTKIGTEGLPISTGEKQRILLSRALFNDPQFLLLDEATSSLDSINESEIVENISKYTKNKIVLIIAHRLSTIRKAKNIIVLHKGKIEEIGNHEELLKNRGYYFNLIQNQYNHES